jgi:hypothetical protein
MKLNRLIRYITLFLGTIFSLILMSAIASSNTVLAATPQKTGAVALTPAPTTTSSPGKASMLGVVETNYATYCQADLITEKPICGGVGGDEVAVSAPRTDFVSEPQLAPLEPIVLYQNDKVVLTRGIF